jgi:hypothetical protein
MPRTAKVRLKIFFQLWRWKKLPAFAAAVTAPSCQALAAGLVVAVVIAGVFVEGWAAFGRRLSRWTGRRWPYRCYRGGSRPGVRWPAAGPVGFGYDGTRLTEAGAAIAVVRHEAVHTVSLSPVITIHMYIFIS